MDSLIIIGSTIGGAFFGGILGGMYGFAVDKSDFPIYAAFTAPVGAVIGAIAGCVISSIGVT